MGALAISLIGMSLSALERGNLYVLEGVVTVDTICWRRLDAPGHDACRLEQLVDGWRLDGAAVCRLDDQPARLVYRLTCDDTWRSREGFVSGWVGDRDYELRIVRTADGSWALNGETLLHLEGCADLDFGFTPATNLLQLRRIRLEPGEAADVPVAWLDVSAGTLALLHQRYERSSADAYWYEAPRFSYAAQLLVRSSGFVRDYPGLWEEEHSSQSGHSRGEDDANDRRNGK